MAHRVPRSIRPAYVLVLSLILCAFLVLTAISTCMLMMISMKAGQSALTRTLARRSAEAAAKIALGELQTAVGPDRRATANAAMMDDSTRDNTAVHPQWCGVWRTDRLKSDPVGALPLIHRNPEGALVDDRAGTSGRGHYARREQTMRWLVSGRDPDAFAPIKEQSVVLAHERIPESEIRAAVEGDDRDGRFAWAARDESQKFSIPSLDTLGTAEDAGALGTPDPGMGLTLLPGWRPEGTRPKIAPLTLGDLAAEGLISTKAVAALEDHVTTQSLGILADSVRGGLRRDLTPFLISGGAAEDVTDGSPLLGAGESENPFAVHGPRFGMIRRWASLHTQCGAAGLEVSPGSRFSAVGERPADVFHDGTHANLPDVGAPISPVIAPVLAEACIFRRLSVDTAKRNAAGAPWLRLHLHPRVVLWNPYSDTLAPATYLVHLRVSGSPVFRLVNANKTITGAISGWRVYDNTLVNYATTLGSLLLTLDCPAIPPGESRVFTPAATAPLYGKSAYSKTYDPLANRLVVTTATTTANLYLEDTDAFEDAGLNALKGINTSGESWRLEPSAAEDFSMSLKLLSGVTTGATWKSLRDAPTLRTISLSTKCGVGTTPTWGWPMGIRVPLGESIEAMPSTGTREGIRLRRFFETTGNLTAYSPSQYMEVAPIADFNPLGVLGVLHPFANATPAASSKSRRPEQFDLFVRDEPDLDSEMQALTPVGGIVAHPFGTPAQLPSGRQVIIASFPEVASRVKSPADLCEAPLSPFVWHPARALGESRMTPFAPANASAHGLAAENYPALGIAAPHLINALRLYEAPRSLREYDIRFEANHAMWDRYTFISGSTEERSRFVQSPQEHRLPLTSITPIGLKFLNRLTGTDALSQGASCVAVAGAFNVNSTSVQAWKYLLATTRGLGPTGKTKDGTPTISSFPRCAYNPGGVAQAEDSPKATTLGHAYRGLSDDEIDRLAQAIVTEVKLRGPFLGIADFINRRLTDNPVGIHPAPPSPNACGSLQAAIDVTRLNPVVTECGAVLSRNAALPGSKFLSHQQAPGRFDGMSAIIAQSDILRQIGPSLTSRGDTFKIIVAGISRDLNGSESIARAEMTVQRLASPFKADVNHPTEPSGKTSVHFGRRIVVTGWRWLD